MPEDERAMAVPEKLTQTLELLDRSPTASERIQLLIDLAGRFEEVPPRIARRPFPKEAQVPACESEAYVFPRSGRTARSTSTSPSRTRRGSRPRPWP